MVDMCALYLFNISRSSDLTDSGNVFRMCSPFIHFLISACPCLVLIPLITDFFLHVVRKMTGFQLFLIDLLLALTKRKGPLLHTHTHIRTHTNPEKYSGWPSRLDHMTSLRQIVEWSYDWSANQQILRPSQIFLCPHSVLLCPSFLFFLCPFFLPFIYYILSSI